MQLTYCDLCGSVIPGNRKSYILTINAFIKEARAAKYDVNNYYDLVELIKKYGDKLQSYEMCEECYNLLKKVITMRKDRLLILKKEIEKINKAPCKKKSNKEKK